MSTTNARDAGGATTTAPPDPRRWGALAVLALVQMMIVLDQTVVNIALPNVQRDLAATSAELAWVVNGYLVAAGGLLLLGGRLGDLYGRRRLFVAGTVLFAVASLVCGIAVDPTVLIVSRFVQGAGEALASPAALGLVALLFTEPAERAKAFGVWGGISGLGSTIGVILSGLIVEFASWRWIFLINIPIALIALVLVPRYVKAAESRSAGRSDWLGAVLVTAGATLVIQGLLAAGQTGASLTAIGLPLVVGTVLLAAFVFSQHRSSSPLVPLRFFAHRTRVSANLSTVFLTSAMAAMFFLVTLYVQEVLGYTPLESGLTYLPFCVVFAGGLALGSQMSTRIGIKPTIVVAFAVGAVGMALMARVDVDSSFAGTILPATTVISLGLALGLPALQNAALHGLSEADAGLGGGVQTAVQQLGSALGLAVLASIAFGTASSSGQTDAAAAVDGYRTAFLVMAGVLVAGGGVAALLMRPIPQAGSDTDTDTDTKNGAGAGEPGVRSGAGKRGHGDHPA